MKHLLAGLAFAVCALGQTGFVRSSGQPVPGATITATSGDRKLTTVSEEDGRYAIEGMTPGEWTVEVEIFGFLKSTKTVTVGAAPASVNRNLQLGFAPAAGAPAAANPVAAAPAAQPAPVRQARQGGGPSSAGPAANRGAAAPNALRPRNGFQAVQNVAETQINQELAQAAPAADPNPGSEHESESFLVNGSLSRGLQTGMDMTGDPRGFGGQGGPGGFGQGGQSGEGAPGAGGFAGVPGGGAPGAGQGGPGGGPGGGGFGGGRGGGGFGGGRGGPGGGFGGGQRPGGPRAGRDPRGGDARDNYFGNRSRRGANQVRGAASFSLRNSALDAAPYALNGQNSEKPSYAQSRFSFMVGGPLVIPKLIHADKTFFFITYNGARARSPNRSVATLPSPDLRLGDFSTQPALIYDPTTHQPFAGNQIPLARISPIATGLLNYFPLPNQPGVIQNYVFVGSNVQNSDSLSVRLNQNLGKKDRIGLGINTQRRNGSSLQTFGFRDLSTGSGWNSDLSWAHTLGPRSISNLHWSFNRNTNDNTPFFANKVNVAAQLGIAGTSDNPLNYGPPNLSFTNYGGLSDASALLSHNQSSTIGESITRTIGQHNLATGFEFRRNQINTRTDQNARGSFSFSGLGTSGFNANGLPLPNTGYDLADFLLGLPNSSSIRFGDTNTYFRGSVYSAYGMDDWRLLPNLSFNLGLRYEYFTPLQEKYGHIANLAIAPGFTGVTVITPADPGVAPALVNPDKTAFSPRAALAWKPSQKSHTSVRIGYGIYFNSSIYNQMANRMAAQPPFANTSSVNTSSQTTLTLASGFTQIPAGKTILNTYAVDQNYRLPYAQTWNTSIQQELPKSLVLEVGYLGTKGTRLDIQRLPNRALPGSPLTAEQRRQIGNAVGFTYESSEGDSIFHAGQVRLMRRFRRGTSGSLLYTFGKSIDNSSTFGGAGNTVAQDDKNLRAERGLSSFDHRHTINANYVLTSPFGQKGEKDWKTRLSKDWTLNGGLNFSTGAPLTARVLGALSDTAGTGAIGSGRADSTGLGVDGGTFFNLAAFTIPPSGRYGNAGRNTIPGPTMLSLNASFGRSFSLGERRRAEFRVESQNPLNRVNISSFGTVVNALNYGYALAAGSMRTVQASLRLRF